MNCPTCTNEKCNCRECRGSRKKKVEMGCTCGFVEKPEKERFCYEGPK